MNLQFPRKLTLILLFVFVVLTVVGFSFYQATVSSQQASTWQKQTQDVLSTLDETLTLSLDSNNAVDSFIVAGSDTYLEPYNRGKQKIVRNLAHLHSVTDITDVTAAELGSLDQLTRALLDRLAYKVNLRKTGGPDTAILELAKTDDMKLLANIRASVERAKAAETARQQVRDQEVDSSLSRTAKILILSSILGIAALVFANIVVFRETSKRSSAENALLEANRDLETRIEERTVELQDANAELTNAAEERSRLLAKEQAARRDAEIANRLRDEFMATVSHELRTPLNSILGWARLMRGRLSPEQTEKAVETIITSAELQNRLIEDLLDVARVVSGKLELEREEVDAVEMIAGTIDTMKPAADAKDIEIRFDEPPTSTPIVLDADKNRIEQVFLNLLTNAIKFSPAGSIVRVAGRLDDGAVEWSVIDQGIGIKPEFLPIVFERFQQDSSAAAGSGGLGLGLAIVKNLVEMHGGEVSVKSDGENLGSEFVVRLPLSCAVAAVDPMAASS